MSNELQPGPAPAPETDRIRAEALWEELGGDLCICQRPDVPHWCEKCQQRIDLIQSALLRAVPPAPRCPVCDVDTLAVWTKDDGAYGITCLACESEFLPRDLAAVPLASPPEGRWQPIETVPKGAELWFWVVPKSPEESYTDTSGNPIVSSGKPRLHRGKYGTWSAFPALRLPRLIAKWRAEAQELDEATGGEWVEPGVKRHCADELEELLARLVVASPPLDAVSVRSGPRGPDSSVAASEGLNPSVPNGGDSGHLPALRGALAALEQLVKEWREQARVVIEEHRKREWHSPYQQRHTEEAYVVLRCADQLANRLARLRGEGRAPHDDEKNEEKT